MDILVDLTESKILRLSPISQWDFRFSVTTGCPHVFTCTLWLSSFPIGASLLGKFGKLQISLWIFLSKVLFFSSNSEILVLYSFPFFFKLFTSWEPVFLDLLISWPINLLNFLLSDCRVDISISISFFWRVNSCIWEILKFFLLGINFLQLKLDFLLLIFDLTLFFFIHY